jgi:hypothetical protein
VGTTIAVDTGSGQPQPPNRASPDEMLLNDLFNVARVHIAIPNRLRIDDDDWSMLALIQAARFVSPDFVLKTGIFDRVLEGSFKFFASVRKTAWPGGSLIAFVRTDE